MSSLWARVEGQFQLRLEFLGLNVVVLRDSDLLVIVEHVESSSPSLRVYLQKTNLKKKVEQVKEQKLCSKVDLQKVRVEHVEEGSTSDIQVELVNQIYN